MAHFNCQGPLHVKSRQTINAQRSTDTKTFTVNECRTARVAELLDDFRTLQHCITDAPSSPRYADDYFLDGWATLRQCAIDGHRILECAADTGVPLVNGGQEEQTKAELKQ